ncbi:MAG: organoarsenical effux MFS transporter ArsJ [Sneathiella sp.]|nr:organoarsenical effux MFS transporter ArsJ [Sneathiella sp.]
MSAVRDYAVVTGAYWGLTLTDGALRMLVLLHFHSLGYSPLELASLFVLYEFFGIVTNLVGGWIAARLGLRVTLYAGLWLQIAALFMLSQLDASWSKEFSVLYVFLSQGLSGIAKDLTKMSAKSSIKALVPEGGNSRLFKWVAALTGSKNALKGAGFFVGGALLGGIGFEGALIVMAAGLTFVLAGAFLLRQARIGEVKSKTPFSRILSKTREINLIALARFFLFGGRDVWFVVGVPLFLEEVLAWSFIEIGTFMALWVIVYGMVQAITPRFVKKSVDGLSAEIVAASRWGWGLSLVPALLAIILYILMNKLVATSTLDIVSLVIISGLALFGALFAINSSLHSYLILAISEAETTSLNVGFYYMANAGGRLAGTLLSGLLYQWGGIAACLAGSAAMIAGAAFIIQGMGRNKNNIGLRIP